MKLSMSMFASRADLEAAQKRQDIEELGKALDLLKRCNSGFSSFIMGRRLARTERDKLRCEIADWVERNDRATQTEAQEGAA